MGRRFTPEEYDRAIGNVVRTQPEVVARALEAVVARNMVKHARDDHPRMDVAEQRLVAYKSIALRKAGRSITRSARAWGGAAKKRFMTRTGILAQSIRAGKAVVSMGGRVISCLFQSLADYSYFVSAGTATSAPHPFLEPAVEANKDKLRNKIKFAIRREWVKSGLS